MNILIVTAHPSPLGHTHIIAKTYADTKRAKNHTVDIIDLYSKEYAVDLLSFTTMHDYVPSKVQKIFQDKLTWAHEIVVIHPIWWGLPPAIMKNWVDLTFWMHFAYKYTPKGDIEKMLTGKVAKIFVTCGGTSWYYHFLILPLLSFWKLCVFEFTGIDVVDVKICGNLDKWRGEKADKHFAKFLKKIEKSH